MFQTHIPHSRAGRLAAASVLSAALLSAAACSSQSSGTSSAAGSGTHSATSAAATPSASAGGAISVGTSSTATSAQPKASGTGGGTNVSGAGAASPCGNSDLKIASGYGTQSQPLQAGSVVFTNISDRTCTLQGYPGLAIAVDKTAVNATRVLNGFRGNLPPLKSPPLVTLSPGGNAYAVMEWMLSDGQNCYPTGTGVIEATAPNTTRTVAISTSALVGKQGICSSLEINPVVPGTFGA